MRTGIIIGAALGLACALIAAAAAGADAGAFGTALALFAAAAGCSLAVVVAASLLRARVTRRGRPAGVQPAALGERLLGLAVRWGAPQRIPPAALSSALGDRELVNVFRAMVRAGVGANAEPGENALRRAERKAVRAAHRDRALGVLLPILAIGLAVLAAIMVPRWAGGDSAGSALTGLLLLVAVVVGFVTTAVAGPRADRAAEQCAARMLVVLMVAQAARLMRPGAVEDLRVALADLGVAPEGGQFDQRAA